MHGPDYDAALRRRAILLSLSIPQHPYVRTLCPFFPVQRTGLIPFPLQSESPSHQRDGWHPECNRRSVHRSTSEHPTHFATDPDLPYRRYKSIARVRQRLDDQKSRESRSANLHVGCVQTRCSDRTRENAKVFQSEFREFPHFGPASAMFCDGSAVTARPVRC